MNLTVSLLTPLAPGGVAVIRVAGDAAMDTVARVCRRRSTPTPIMLSPGRPKYCRLFDGEESLDDVVAALDDRGRVEICLHGGVRIVQRALLLFERLGARVTPAEELSVASSPLDVAAAVDAMLPAATTRTMVAWLMAQRALLPGFIERAMGRAMPAVSAEEMSAFKHASRAAIRAFAGLRIALIGPPNAGKSTLANALIGRDRVITSDVPGTTRDWVEESALIAGWPVTLTDTAGMRTTEDTLEAEAIRRGVQRAGGADLVLCVEDGNADESLAIFEGLPANTPRLRVFNKQDMRLINPKGLPGVHISALTGAGLPELEQAMSQRLGLDLLQPETPAVFRSEQIFETSNWLY